MYLTRELAVAMKYGGADRTPFTAAQWQELENQTLIYNYLIAELPVPSDLILPIRRSFEALSHQLIRHPILGYCLYNVKKLDPKPAIGPARCKRTDGKNWRCSKDAHGESKYCERHMNLGRKRSRKPVKSQQLLTVTEASNINTMSCQNVSSASSSKQLLTSVTDSGGMNFWSYLKNTEVDVSTFLINNKDIRCSQGLSVNVDGQNYPSSGDEKDRSMDSNVDRSWGLMPSHIPTSSLLMQQNDSYMQTNSLQPNMTNTLEPMFDATSMYQHCFSGGEIGSQEQENLGQNVMCRFFREWSKDKEPWSNLDATTGLSISMNPARNACSPNDA